MQFIQTTLLTTVMVLTAWPERISASGDLPDGWE